MALKPKKGSGKTLPFFYEGTPKHKIQKIFPILAFLIVFLCLSPIHSQAPSRLPEIARLDSRDTTFRQFIQDVQASRRALIISRHLPPQDLASFLTIYTYVAGENDTLFTIAARCNIPYGTLATINRLSNIDEALAGRVLLLPSMPGIFIPETPETDLEYLLFTARVDGGLNEGVFLSIPREGRTERFLFIPGADFTSTERVFFLDRGFRFPMQHFRVTSFYGPRINPVTGMHSFHRGIDLAAPYGTEVFSVRAGTVAEIGYNSILGNYVIVSHDNGWTSLYGHLSTVNTSLHAPVQAGTFIGRVGSTGMSTGPHLHFELRHHGQSRDPGRLLGIFTYGSYTR